MKTAINHFRLCVAACQLYVSLARIFKSFAKGKSVGQILKSHVSMRVLFGCQYIYVR